MNSLIKSLNTFIVFENRSIVISGKVSLTLFSLSPGLSPDRPAINSPPACGSSYRSEPTFCLFFPST